MSAIGGVAGRGDDRQDEQRAAHADVLEDARDEERLQHQRQQVDVGLHGAGQRADDRTPRVAPSAVPAATGRARFLRDERVQHEPAERVDEVVDEHQHRDEQEIALLEHQREPAWSADRLLGLLLLRVLTMALSPVDDDRQRHRHQQPEGRDEHQRCTGRIPLKK